MQYLKCKCGEREMWTTDGIHDCQGCEKCGTTFANHPDGHRPLQPHKWDILYNQNTGRPYKICKKCGKIDEESYKEAEKKWSDEDMRKYHENMQYLYEQEIRDIERFCKIAKEKKLGEGKTYDQPAQLAPDPDNIPTLEDLPIPENLDEAIKTLTNDENVKFVNECKDEDEFVYQLHHGFGTGLRNGWGLWSGSVLSKWFNEHGIYHADDMSSIILTSMYRTVKGQDIKLDEQIKEYRDYWKKVDPSVNSGKK